MKNKISVIIPVYNEDAILDDRLSLLFRKVDPETTAEIILTDGGSSDGTIESAKSLADQSPVPFRLLQSKKGRATQLNRGASEAVSEVLYFLHIDSIPPDSFDRLISERVRKGAVGGCFRMRFDDDHILLRVSQWFTRINLPICRGGDQSLFMTKKVFDTLHGFDEAYDIYEDCDLINRFYKKFDFTIIPQEVTTSARKYVENGFWQLQYRYAVIHLLHYLGSSPGSISSYYRRTISQSNHFNQKKSL